MHSRIAKNSAETIRAEIDGAATVEVLRSDGSALVAAGTATTDAGPDGYRELELTPEQTADVDLLTAIWSLGGAELGRTFHDVVGNHYVTIKRLRQLEPLEDEEVYEDHVLAFWRDVASYAIEDACHGAYTERFGSYAFEPYNDRGRRTLPEFGVRSIRWAKVDGVLAESLVAYKLAPMDIATGPFTPSNVTELGFTYAAGVPTPMRISRAVELVTRDLAFREAPDGQGSAIPERATSLSTDGGSFSLLAAVGAGSMFDLPEVNAIVSDYTLHSVGGVG